FVFVFMGHRQSSEAIDSCSRRQVAARKTQRRFDLLRSLAEKRTDDRNVTAERSYRVAAVRQNLDDPVRAAQRPVFLSQRVTDVTLPISGIDHESVANRYR